MSFSFSLSSHETRLSSNLFTSGCLEPYVNNEGEKIGTLMTKISKEILDECIAFDSYTKDFKYMSNDYYNRVIPQKGGQANTLYHHDTNWENYEDKSCHVFINVTLLKEQIEKGNNTFFEVMDSFHGLI